MHKTHLSQTNHIALDIIINVIMHNKQPAGCEAQLAMKMPIHVHLFQGQEILTSKVCQTDLVFGF